MITGIGALSLLILGVLGFLLASLLTGIVLTLRAQPLYDDAHLWHLQHPGEPEPNETGHNSMNDAA
ncbi:MAG TPA: hypothetical protein VKM93_29055 [Terriglobia bacterium]|nr:hypothetical protein [Terriglobia bacterium]